ncbi:MAG: diacylglycerol kinase family protein [Patescibacteria group bacterium]
MNRLYAYLYDDFLTDSSYQRVLANVETRCSALGIQGRVSRLAIFRSPKEIVEGLVHDGAQNIVVVGNDTTLQKVMWFLPDLPVTVGYIPLCKPSDIAGLLGIPVGEAACETLAARRVETVDIGRINERYFLTEVLLRDARATVDVDGRFRIGPSQAGTISIRNLGGVTSNGLAMSNAKDGWLELAIQPSVEEESPSRFSFFKKKAAIAEETKMLLQNGSIQSREPIDALVDGHVLNGFSFSLSILPDKLKIISGRNKHLEPVEQGLVE